MPTDICFTITTELYKKNGKYAININNSHIEEINNDIKAGRFSRRDCDNQIFSYDLGIINLINSTIKINKNSKNILNFEFTIDKKIESIIDAKEVIWCLFTPAYSKKDGEFEFTIEKILKRYYYKLKILNTPDNIKFNFIQ